MNKPHKNSVKVFAPAKLNLFLHVLKRHDNGYHDLESMVGFCDIGDELIFEEHPDFSFSVVGDFGGAFRDKELDSSPGSSNLIVKAIWALSQHYRKSPTFKITLKKNLPLAAGIGGGSSDAASAIWGALEYWGILKNFEDLKPLLTSLGADVTVCFFARACYMRGIGDSIELIENIPELPIVLVNPLKQCSTKDVFVRIGNNFDDRIVCPNSFEDREQLFEFIRKQHNALENAAQEIVPDIGNLLNILNSQKNIRIARLSGSGATCFGLFDDYSDALAAEKNIKEQNPDWWVRSGWLNRIERY